MSVIALILLRSDYLWERFTIYKYIISLKISSSLKQRLSCSYFVSFVWQIRFVLFNNTQI